VTEFIKLIVDERFPLPPTLRPYAVIVRGGDDKEVVGQLSGRAEDFLESLLYELPTRGRFLEVLQRGQFTRLDSFVAGGGLICIQVLKEVLDVRFAGRNERIEDDMEIDFFAREVHHIVGAKFDVRKKYLLRIRILFREPLLEGEIRVRREVVRDSEYRHV